MTPPRKPGALTLRSLVFTAALVVAGAFAWFVWPTPYRVNSEGIRTREHRIFGERQILLRDEWVADGSDGVGALALEVAGRF